MSIYRRHTGGDCGDGCPVCDQECAVCGHWLAECTCPTLPLEQEDQS